MTARAPTVMIVAAEASGDVLGAGLAQALRARLGPDLRLVGVGGPRLREQGLDSLFDIGELSILGFVEGLLAYRRVVARADETADLAVKARPDVAVLIDSWGFTLRVAQRLRRRLPGTPLIKYVGPQVWASRPGRARTLARTVDRLLTLYAMDAPYFTRFGLETTFVGAPALQALEPPLDRGGALGRLQIDASEPVLLVLPGSRSGEVARLARPFGECIARLVADRPHLNILVPAAETVAGHVRLWAATLPGRVRVVEDEVEKRDAFQVATVALACSGTVAVELAMAQVPMVVAYRTNRVTFALFKLISTTRYVCLLNIASGDEVVPELLQARCTGLRLAAALAARLDDPAIRTRQVAAQERALDRLGRARTGEPAARAADAVIDVMRIGGGPGVSPAARSG